jgi:hypothetical protein
MWIVTASEANRQFSSVLRDVVQGEVVTVTSRGNPASISSASGASKSAAIAEFSCSAIIKEGHEGGVVCVVEGVRMPSIAAPF